MEVKNPQTAFLSNYEVLSLINEMKPTSFTVNQEASQFATIMYETSHYLQDFPCINQNPDKIHRLMTTLKDFPIPLTKLEKLMICNNPPESVLQLSLILNEKKTHMTECESNKILINIKRHRLNFED
ncbi:hypothetical protein PGB90_003089 [Kerria lacca]